MSSSRVLIRYWGVLPIVLAIGVFALRACLHERPRDRMAAVASEPGDPPGTQAYRGMLVVDRGGPVVIGFQSSTRSRLAIGARTIDGKGIAKDRILLPAGTHAMRFAAGPDARLVWNPVGRRGDPEYVPSSAVAPPGGSRGVDLDGWFALGLLILLVASLVVLARARLATVSRETWIAIGGVFTLALAARLVGLGAEGQTWDEDVNWAAGKNYVTNVLAIDFSDRSWGWNYEHPPIMKLLAGVGANLCDSGFGAARALFALLVSAACALLVPIGKRLFGLRAGVLAGAIAALLPPLVAHGRLVGHEAPTVLWWSLGILLALCVHDDLGEPSERAQLRTLQNRLVGVGIVVGIAVASRFVNGLLGPLCVLIVFVNAPAAWRKPTLAWWVLMVVATIVVFYAVWPRLWTDPIGALRLSLAKLDSTHAPEPFLGAVTNAPPPSYFLVYIAATLPVGVLVAVIAGFVHGGLERTRAWWIALAWFVIPLAIAASPVRQDGVRYVIPSVLALAVIAAAGLAFVATKLARFGKHVFAILAAVVVLYLGATWIRVYPYYLDYFGEHVGGARTVHARRWFETAWWGEGLDRAIAYVNERAPPNAIVSRVCVLPAHLTWFREDLWAPMTNDSAKAGWIVEYVSTALPCRPPADARVVFTVDANGAPLARVWRRGP